MVQAKHCNLCEHPKRNLKNGLTCGLTDRKPDFKVFCSDIKFSDSFKEYLPELSNQIEDVKKRRISVYLKFVLLGILGLAIIFGSYPLLERTFEMEFGYSAWIRFQNTLLFYIAGASLISMGFWSLNKYRRELKKLESEKRELNNVLKNYNIDTESLMNREINKKTTPQQRV